MKIIKIHSQSPYVKRMKAKIAQQDFLHLKQLRMEESSFGIKKLALNMYDSIINRFI